MSDPSQGEFSSVKSLVHIQGRIKEFVQEGGLNICFLSSTHWGPKKTWWGAESALRHLSYNHLSCTLFVIQGGENFIYPKHHLSYTSSVLHLICPTAHLSCTSFVLKRGDSIICFTLHFSYTSIVLFTSIVLQREKNIICPTI